MVSVTHPTHDIEVTAERLQEGSARLQIQKQALERNLLRSWRNLGSVRRALSTFESLMRATAAAEQAQVPKPVVLQTEIASTCTSGAEAAEQERGRGPSCSGWGRHGRAEDIRPAHRADHGALRRSRRRRCTGP